jgi:hypothetical protein
MARDLPPVWEGLGSASAVTLKLLDPFQVDWYLATQLLQLLVLQFHWALTALGLGLALSYLRRRRRMLAARTERLHDYRTVHGRPRAWSIVVDVVHQRLAFTSILFVAVLYLLTRLRPYSNTRYLLPLFALFLLLFVQLLAVGIHRRGLRMAVTATVLLGLFGPSLEGTVDPISRRLLGTFDFGRHPMLRMTALTGECCGAGRDQLVYNLQFTRFHDLQNRAYQDIRPTADTVILAAWAANFGQLWPLSRDDYTRSVPSARTFSPRYASAEEFTGAVDVSEVYFIAFPNVDNRPALEALGHAFARRHLTRYEWRGYALDVYRFSSVAGPPPGEPPARRSSADGTDSRESAGESRPPPG